MVSPEKALRRIARTRPVDVPCMVSSSFPNRCATAHREAYVASAESDRWPIVEVTSEVTSEVEVTSWLESSFVEVTSEVFSVPHASAAEAEHGLAAELANRPWPRQCLRGAGQVGKLQGQQCWRHQLIDAEKIDHLQS